jgi:hypothetical protein
MNRQLCRQLALVVAIALSAVPAAAIVLGQFDNFQSGTLQNWTGGSNPSNQPSGGPDGAYDRYLRITSGGVSSNLGVFNSAQWAGSYGAAGVTRVNIDLDNFGPDPVSLRIMIATPGCNGPPLTCTAWTSTNATVLPAGVGWVRVEFSLAEPDLTRVLGTDSYATSIANVDKLTLRHDDGAPSPPGTQILVNAVLGIDNVTALPEPPRDDALAMVGALALAVRIAARREFPGVDRGPARKIDSAEL